MRTSSSEKQANLELDRTSTKVIQASGLTMGMVIFDVDMCPMVLYMYIDMCELFMDRYAYDMIGICYDM